MSLSKEQSQAISAIANHDFSQRPFFLGGYAGTGKTFLLNTLRQYFPRILYLAPTGKACTVLSSKIPDAKIRTIHSALYSAQEVSERQIADWRTEGANGDEYAARMYEYYTRPNALRVRFSLNPCKELFSSLIVVDESSMVGWTEYNNLTSITKNIIFVGDPAQLPPVESGSIFPNQFDAFLRDVQRAALESPITRLAMEIRQGKFSGWEKWVKEGIGVSKKISKADYLEADQVLAGTNQMRNFLNKGLRKEQEFYLPVLNDKVIVKENVRRKNQLYLVNGDIGTVSAFSPSSLTTSLEVEYKKPSEHLIVLNSELMAKLYGKPMTPSPSFADPVKLDYAYCITVHASQGSEWPSVVIYDDQMWSGRASERRKLLYTAVTRAKEKLTIVTGG